MADQQASIEIDQQTRKIILAFQENEISEHQIYSRLARSAGSPENRAILERIATEERQHAELWQRYTRKKVRPNRLKLWFYYLLSRVFGLTFGIKLMELGEERVQVHYSRLFEIIPEARAIAEQEHEHELALIDLLDEERLRYISSIVLGLNDALVELTGALTGLTLALQDARLIALTGSITGIAAALSMGASEYLSMKAEETARNPLKASFYTGITYLLTVVVLVLPYLLLENYYLSLGLTLTAAILIIAFFNYYISVAKDLPFRRRFLEMAALSLGVAAFSFLIGFLLRSLLGVEV